MATRFLDNLTRVIAACSQPGPFVYAVHTNCIERFPLSSQQSPSVTKAHCGMGVAAPYW